MQVLAPLVNEALTVVPLKYAHIPSPDSGAEAQVMGTEITDLEQMMQTLSAASTDPNAVSVGDFAKAVQSLQAELKMLETEVDRLGTTVGAVYEAGDRETADIAVPHAEVSGDQEAAAIKP